MNHLELMTTARTGSAAPQLRCPTHPDEGWLEPVADSDAERAAVGIDGLRCVFCGRYYAVTDGIPDLASDSIRRDDFFTAEAQQWDAQAQQYEANRGRDARYLAAVTAAVDALRPRPGELVLDAGCGTGLTVRRYAPLGVRVVALDLSTRSLRYLRKTVSGAAVWPVRGDLTALPFATGTFDRVLCAYALQHLPDEDARRQSVHELARVARPGAQVVVTAHQFSMPRKAAGWSKEGPAGGASGRLQYIYRFEGTEFRRLLASELAIERVYGAGFPLPYRLKLSPASRVAETLLQRFSRLAAFADMLVGVGRRSG